MRFAARATLAFAILLMALYLSACVLLYAKQRELLYFPQPMAAGGESQAQPLRGHSPRVLVSTREAAGADAVIYFGGNAEDVSRNLPALARAFPGRALYLLHYRGYGGSEGKPTEAGLMQDALALFDQVHAHHARVTLIGRSLGSGLAVHVASLRPVSRLVLVTPYDSIVGVAQGHYPFMPVSWLMIDRYESFRYAPKVRAPTRVLAAAQDEVIPRASTEQLLGRFTPGAARMIVLPGVGHNSIAAHPRYLELLSAP